eukprot:1271999-Prymnesium_polylepis.1
MIKQSRNQKIAQSDNQASNHLLGSDADELGLGLRLELAVDEKLARVEHVHEGRGVNGHVVGAVTLDRL